jgi:sialic acid synthase SpsE
MNTRLELPNQRYIGETEIPYIIAEAGINHNGSIDIAKDLIRYASLSGADAIKFQKRTIDEMYIKSFLDEPYNKPYAFGRTYGEHKKKLEFSEEQYFELQDYARLLKIDFLVSGFDFAGFEFIEKQLNVPIHKVASPFITHFPLLKQVAMYGKPVILSTGMHTYEEIEAAVNYVKNFNDQIVLFQATTLYPCPDREVNLNVLKTFKDKLDVLVGYSSHDNGVVLPAVSVALGACVIEKHFTLDRTMVGPDHIASVEPRGLELIVKYCKSAHYGLGSYEKELQEAEKEQRIKYGVSIVSSKDLKKGDVMDETNITVKCPGGGISPVLFDKLIGKKILTDIKADTIIKHEDVEF